MQHREMANLLLFHSLIAELFYRITLYNENAHVVIDSLCIIFDIYFHFMYDIFFIFI